MEALFELSLFKGILLLVTATSLFGVVTVLLVRKVIVNRLTKQHERVGRLLFRVTVSVLALLISLSYANEKIGYNKVVNSLEQESAIISTLYMKLGMYQSEPAEQVRQKLADYVSYTVEDKWEDAVNNPYFSKMAATLLSLNKTARDLVVENELQQQLKPDIIADIDSITKTMQIRFYSTQFKLPYLTYILAFGLLISWCFYAVYRPNMLTLSFLTLFNIFIALVFYFVVTLGNPMSGPLKIKPVPFTILIEKGLSQIK